MSSDQRRSVSVLPLTAAVSALGVFGLLTADVLLGGPSGWDRLLFRHLYNGESDWLGGPTPGQSNPVLNAAEPFLHRVLDERMLLLLCAVVIVTFALLKRTRAAAFFTAALAVAALVPVLKQLIDRPSPFPLPDDPSFPSGHATLSLAAAAALFVLMPSGRWQWLAGVVGGILVLAVGVAVVADSGHWPSDVIAGWCLAFAWVAVLGAVLGHRFDTDPDLDGGQRPARSSAEPQTPSC